MADCLYLILCLDIASCHQQVSLARSPLLKNEDSNCEGLLLTSYDRTLVVKEICSEEVEEMHHILSEYHQVVKTLVGLFQKVHTTVSLNPELFYACKVSFDLYFMVLQLCMYSKSIILLQNQQQELILILSHL